MEDVFRLLSQAGFSRVLEFSELYVTDEHKAIDLPFFGPLEGHTAHPHQGRTMIHHAANTARAHTPGLIRPASRLSQYKLLSTEREVNMPCENLRASAANATHPRHDLW